MGLMEFWNVKSKRYAPLKREKEEKKINEWQKHMQKIISGILPSGKLFFIQILSSEFTFQFRIRC